MRNSLRSVILLGLWVGTAVPAAEVLEEPIAIVGKTVILRSEWESQLALFAMQARENPNDPAVRDTLGHMVLEQMINDALVLIVAEEDTLLTVTPEEINEALEEHIASLRLRFKSEEEFREGLALEGLTERDLRVSYRQDVHNQLLKQRLMQRKLSQVAVSNGEVREFYDYYKDSLPIRPAGIKLAHILLTVEISERLVDSLRQVATRILGEIHAGLDFAEAARQYSGDATASVGGDLGWFSKGQMVPQFEQAAFALSPGQSSGVVRTPLGWHLIQCVEREADRLHARHILLPLTPSRGDSTAVLALADSVSTRAIGGDDFCALAQKYSHDEESRKNCGELGWYPLEEMYDEFKSALRNAVSGDMTPPVQTKFGWHILRVLDRRAERRLNIEDDWDRIKQIARQDKTNRILLEWIAEIRAETYVDIRALSETLTIEPGVD